MLSFGAECFHNKKAPNPKPASGAPGKEGAGILRHSLCVQQMPLVESVARFARDGKASLGSLLLQKVLLSQVFDPKWTEFVLERAQSVCKLLFSVQTGISWKPGSLLSDRPRHEAQNGVWVPGSSCAGSADGASRCRQLLTTTAGNGLKAADLHRTDFGSLCASGMFSGAGAPASRAAGGRSVPPQLRAGAGN